MDSSSGSDLEVEVRSGPAPRKEDVGPIASGRECQAAVAEDAATEIEFVDLKGNEIKMPKRVLEVLEKAADFKEFRAKRKFRYLHLFSGDPDVLGEAVMEEGARNQIWVESVGLDRKSNDEIDLHEINTILKWKKEIEEDQWDGIHSGWPCGSFSMARWKPGGPPPVRSRDEIYGLGSNNARQQQEADRGTLAATRSVALMKLQCQRADARGAPRVATGENPPGTDGIEGSAWILPEVEMEAEEATRFGGSGQVGRKAGRGRYGRYEENLQVPELGEAPTTDWEGTHRTCGTIPQEAGGTGGEKDHHGVQENFELGVVAISDGHQESQRD